MVSKVLIVAGILMGLISGALAGVIAFDSPSAPPALAAGNSVPGIEEWNFSELPRRQSTNARDNAPLYYRLYPGPADRVVVLVHGSTGSGAEMHKLAQVLQASGASVYAIALRGHGGSGTRNGDVSYIGQPDDDLADLVNGLGLNKRNIHRTLIGFSSGGGFVLRIAGSRLSDMFNDYLAISPYISQDSPTNKPNSGGWAGIALPRIVALSLLDRLGMPWFQELPVVHFATTAKANEYRTPVYSFRLIASLQLGQDWRSVIAQISAPTQVVVGADDEFFKADQFQPTLHVINPHIPVTVVPKQTHLGMIAQPDATAALVKAWREISGS
jgi:non-heme chloroperoxidase